MRGKGIKAWVAIFSLIDFCDVIKSTNDKNLHRTSN